jgi:uncharacterized protein YjbI with pentapeptide repeats
MNLNQININHVNLNEINLKLINLNQINPYQVNLNQIILYQIILNQININQILNPNPNFNLNQLNSTQLSLSLAQLSPSFFLHFQFLDTEVQILKNKMVIFKHIYKIWYQFCSVVEECLEVTYKFVTLRK